MESRKCNIPDIGSKNTIRHVSTCSPGFSRRLAVRQVYTTDLPPNFLRVLPVLVSDSIDKENIVCCATVVCKQEHVVCDYNATNGQKRSPLPLLFFAGVTPPSILSPFRSTTPRRRHGRRQVHRPCSGRFRICGNWYQFHHH